MLEYQFFTSKFVYCHEVLQLKFLKFSWDDPQSIGTFIICLKYSPNNIPLRYWCWKAVSLKVTVLLFCFPFKRKCQPEIKNSNFLRSPFRLIWQFSKTWFLSILSTSMRPNLPSVFFHNIMFQLFVGLSFYIFTTLPWHLAFILRQSSYSFCAYLRPLCSAARSWPLPLPFLFARMRSYRIWRWLKFGLKWHFYNDVFFSWSFFLSLVLGTAWTWIIIYFALQDMRSNIKRLRRVPICFRNRLFCRRFMTNFSANGSLIPVKRTRVSLIFHAFYLSLPVFFCKISKIISCNKFRIRDIINSGFIIT